MTANIVLDALKDRRSIRNYTEEPVSDEAVINILEAGRWSPSGMNNQPFRFMVFRKEDPRFETLAKLTKYSSVVRSCAVMIGLFLDKTATYHEKKDQQSAGACVQNMMLAAHAQGLGSVWLGQMMNNAPQVLEALGFSESDYEFITVITVGHPAENGSANRNPLEHYMLEKF